MATDLEVLAAIRAGTVASRYHLSAGWAVRDTSRTSSGRGGGMGLNVTPHAGRLEKAGLAVEAPARGYADRPWRPTAAGMAKLAAYPKEK